MKSLLQNKNVAQFIQKMPTVKQLFFSAFGVALLTFLLLSLLSYNPDDPAWSHFSGNEQITNIAGRLGAWVADILRVFFGLGAWWLVFVVAYELIRLWWQHSPLAWQLRMPAYGALLLFISAMLAWWAGIDNAQQALYLGGVFGFELYSGLSGFMGPLLPPLFLSALFLLIATLTFNIRWQAMFHQLLSLIFPNQDDNKNGSVALDNTDSISAVNDNEQTQTALHIIKHAATESEMPTPEHHSSRVLEEFLQTSGLKEEIRTQQHSDISFDTYNDNQSRAKSIVNTNTHDTNIQTQVIVEEPIIQQEPDNNHDDYHDSVDTKRNITHPPQPSWDDTSDTDDEDNALVYVPKTTIDIPDAKPITASVPKKNNTTALAHEQKSRAMSTLEYRMSLSPIPELSLLDPPSPKTLVYSQAQLHQLSELLEIKLKEFNIDGKVVHATVGPVVTRFEVNLAAGIKVSRVTRIAQDLARSMSMTSLRVLPVIAGKPYIGIEVPNRHRQVVSLIELLDTPEYKKSRGGITLAVGVDITGKPVIADLAKAPHMLVAGTTGSGKSVLVNSFLLSMLLKYTPDELRLVLIDPKQVEMANYEEIPHLLTPVVTDMNEAVAVLNWCVNEMERRYRLLTFLRVRNIFELNNKIKHAEQAGEPLIDPLWSPLDSVSVSSAPKLKPLPYIVVVADEFADMLMQLGKTAEEPIVRIAQKARAAGIHLILATQRPVANVVTGLIKSNIPSRVALRVNSSMDSRIIIEEVGAENMLGHGDMMFIPPGKNFTERAHGAYVKDNEVNKITDAWRERGKPDYIDLTEHSYTDDGMAGSDGNNEDEYYQLAVHFIVENKKASISSLQRRFSIGYNRAARLMDIMEENGVVSKPDSSGKRQILI